MKFFLMCSVSIFSCVFKSIDKLISIYICMKTFICTCMFVFYHILVLIVTRFILTMQTYVRGVCACMLTDLLSFWVLLIRIYTHIYMYEETKTIRLIRLHLDLLCVRMSSLLLMYNRGSYQTYIYINIKETHLTL
jgi:hypothetical protein